MGDETPENEGVLGVSYKADKNSPDDDHMNPTPIQLPPVIVEAFNEAEGGVGA